MDSQFRVQVLLQTLQVLFSREILVLFLPSTSHIAVTGLQFIYNIVQNNSNGVLIASVEPTPKILVEFNYLQNNSGNTGGGNGKGVFLIIVLELKIPL